jgi:hypothetical protein
LAVDELGGSNFDAKTPLEMKWKTQRFAGAHSKCGCLLLHIFFISFANSIFISAVAINSARTLKDAGHIILETRAHEHFNEVISFFTQIPLHFYLNV